MPSVPCGNIEVQNRSLGGHSPKSTPTLWQVRLNNCILFSQFSLIVLMMPRPSPIGIRSCACLWGPVEKCYCWSRGSDSCYSQSRPLEACCYWNFCARQVHGGSLDHHTSSRPCFDEDGPTRSLCKCSGLDGADEEFVWHKGWPENHQYPAFVPWLPCL